MIRPLRTTILASAAVLAFAMTAGVAGAQTAPAAPAKGEHHGMRREEGGGEHGMHHGDPKMMADHLRTMLQLTPAQEPALQAFLAAMKPPEGREGRPGWGGPRGDHEGMHEHGPMPADPAARKAEMDKRIAEMKARKAEWDGKRAEFAAMTTPQKLDMMMKRAGERQAHMQARVAAIKAFYAALTPSQQKAFDLMHQGMMGGGMHRHGGRGEHGGPGMRGPHDEG